MIYFKSPESGEVFAYDADQVEAGVVKPGLVKMSDAEVEAHMRPAPLTRSEVEIRRLIAYADPVNGSDRFLAEASAERAAGNIEKADAAYAKCLARRSQIAEENPWPN